MKNINRIAIGVVCLCFIGCVPTKKLMYMQQLSSKEAITKEGALVPYDIDEYRLQSNDILDISMKTSSEELNLLLKSGDSDNVLRNMGGLNSGDAFFLNGYSLDDQGLVDLPLIGEIKMIGMNVKEAKLAVEEKLKKYVTGGNYYVKVRLGGVRYGALGEFNRPGKYTVLQNRVTIFEAIANAGDMTTAAKRTEVIIVRQYPDGSKTHTVNLLSDKIFASEFFFIRPNDMLYAQPLKAKQFGTNLTFVQSLEVVLSLVTVVLLYLNIVN